MQVQRQQHIEEVAIAIYFYYRNFNSWMVSVVKRDLND